jgi:8-oxo-dGTP pyrophosphatase MutT (NUDIX family)
MSKKLSWIYRQSGVIPYRIKKGQIEVLLITSRSKGLWIIPKGIIERELSPQESAAKEAEEEAGVTGKVGEKSIGKYRARKWGGTCTVKVYPMKVSQVKRTWDEAWERKRRWFEIEEAAERISRKSLSRMILELPEFLGRSG